MNVVEVVDVSAFCFLNETVIVGLGWNRFCFDGVSAFLVCVKKHKIVIF